MAHIPDAADGLEARLAPLIERLGIEKWSDQILGSDYTAIEDGKLTKLDLGLVELDHLPGDTFDLFPHLQMLNLTATGLSDLPEEIFCQLEDLRVLGLGRNRISKMGPEFFRQNRKLELVSLDGNDIEPFEVEGVDLRF